MRPWSQIKNSLTEKRQNEIQEYEEKKKTSLSPRNDDTTATMTADGDARLVRSSSSSQSVSVNRMNSSPTMTLPVSTTKLGGLVKKKGEDYVKDILREEKRRFTVISERKSEDTTKDFDAKMLSLSNALWPIYDMEKTGRLGDKELEKLISHYMRQFKEYIPRFWARHYFTQVDRAVHDKNIPEEPRKRIAQKWHDVKATALKDLATRYNEYIEHMPTHVQEWLKLMDLDGDGLISKDEFVNGFGKTTATLGLDVEGSIRMFDLDSKVKATMAEIDTALGKHTDKEPVERSSTESQLS